MEKNVKILVVEDSPTQAMLLKHMLIKNNYEASIAKNGAAALELIKQEPPTMIISDVMMPEMDGFELCKKLKTDERTSHIPIILLTARAAKTDKIEGLETGADDYIPKPFDADELLVRVKNLIEQRRKLRERFSREVLFNPEKIAVTSVDEIFLKRVINIAQENIADSEFSVEF